MRLEGKVAIVTGAASGIGEAIATRLASEGARVVIADVHFARARNVSELLEARGMVTTPIKVDVCDQAQVAALFEQTVSRFGAVDILVNNAGLGKSGHIEHFSPEMWDAVLRTNVSSMYLTVRQAIPLLKERGWGRIINLASVEGLRGTGLTPAYTTSKHAVVGLTRSLALALAPHGITVNALCPGLIVTRMTKTLLAVPEYEEAARKSIPVGRLGRPEDVAGAAAFLASDDASFITGHTLVIDGGMTVGVGFELPDE